MRGFVCEVSLRSCGMCVGFACENRPGTAQYCRLSVNMSLFAKVRTLMKIGREQFQPPPKVRLHCLCDPSVSLACAGENALLWRAPPPSYPYSHMYAHPHMPFRTPPLSGGLDSGRNQASGVQ